MVQQIKLNLLFTVLVPKEGFEPTRPCGHCDLNAARLPFRHLGTREPGQRPGLLWSQSAWWAMEGSNLRPPRCERGALTTELTAPCRWDTLNYRHTHTPAQASQAKEQHSHNCVLLVRTTSFDAHRHTKKTNYWAVMPPSMTNSDPVTNDDSSDARYRIPAAMSSGWPMRPRGILATRSL